MIYAVLGYEPIDFQVLNAYTYAAAALDPVVTEWATLYAKLCPIAGIRTSFAWAQACHETGFFKYQGTAKPEWLNPAGLGVTGAPDIGNRFVSKEDGVRAHLGHLLWYFGPTHPITGFCSADQRHFGEHKRLENDGTQLGGRWAPSPTYGAVVLTKAYDVLVRQV